MIEETMFDVTFEFKNGDVKKIRMVSSEVDTMFDKLWEREQIKWLNIWEEIINLDAVQYIYHAKVEEEEEEED